MAEGAHVLDAGQVGTEMLYWLVGSRELDGGLMCTASHNPKAYTGCQAGQGGRDRPVRATRASRTCASAIEAGLGEAPGGGSVEEVDIYPDFHRAALGFIDADAVKPLGLVVEGSHGMAAPMVGPLLDELGLDPVKSNWQADGEFPDRGPNPLLEENRKSIVELVRATRAPISGSPGTATPTAASSSTGTERSSTATS